MSILVIGDSLSFGSELKDMPAYLGIYGNNAYATEAELQPSQYSWPSLISKRLNIKVDNLSVAGGSNDRIFRLAVSESLKQSYQYVICAWTTTDRFDFSYRGRDLPLTAGVDVSLKFPWFKSYLANHYDAQKNQQRWLAQLVSLQALFKQQQQQYLFVQSCSIPIDKSLRYIQDKVDIEWDFNMMEMCAKLPHGKHGHFLEQGHELTADYILSKISL